MDKADLANLVVSLSTAEAMFDKGLRLETHFWYHACLDGSYLLLHHKPRGAGNADINDNIDYPAALFGELWAAIPDEIYDEETKVSLFISIAKDGDDTVVHCMTHQTDFVNEYRHANPAEALGLMVMWLLDNGYLEVG